MQVYALAQMYAVAVSGTNSCKNRLLENYQSNEKTYSCTTHARNGTNCIAAVHSCKLRKPNLYEGLEIELYEGLGISFEIRVPPE